MATLRLMRTLWLKIGQLCSIVHQRPSTFGTLHSSRVQMTSCYAVEIIRLFLALQHVMDFSPVIEDPQFTSTLTVAGKIFLELVLSNLLERTSEWNNRTQQDSCTLYSWSFWHQKKRRLHGLSKIPQSHTLKLMSNWSDYQDITRFFEELTYEAVASQVSAELQVQTSVVSVFHPSTSSILWAEKQKHSKAMSPTLESSSVSSGKPWVISLVLVSVKHWVEWNLVGEACKPSCSISRSDPSLYRQTMGTNLINQIANDLSHPYMLTRIDADWF